MFISAYLSILDDWDILKPALMSVIDRVDEIIVVDGAYRWMTPYFIKSERDPAKSLPQVYEVLAELGPKIRIINGIWENELEKRIAGYEACKGKYRYRVDADEIFFFADDATERFFSSAYAVAEMDMPIYVAPGLISGTEGKRFPRQAFLFDSDKISSREHLSYLWLVLPAWERELFGNPQGGLIFPEPLAFNAHLTHWRPPSSSLARARFYVMNYMRQYGAQLGGGDSPNTGINDFTFFFDKITPAEFDEVMLGKSLVVMPSADQLICQTTPLTVLQDQSISYIHDHFLKSLAALNFNLLEQPRTIMLGQTYYLDATLPESLPTSVASNSLTIEFSDVIAAAKIELESFFLDRSQNNNIRLEESVRDRLATVSIPDLPSDKNLLRRMLSITVWTSNKKEVLKFKFVRSEQLDCT